MCPGPCTASRQTSEQIGASPAPDEHREAQSGNGCTVDLHCPRERHRVTDGETWVRDMGQRHGPRAACSGPTVARVLEDVAIRTGVREPVLDGEIATLPVSSRTTMAIRADRGPVR